MKQLIFLIPIFINALFVYVSIKFVDLWVILQEMDEANNYTLTYEERVAGFTRFTVVMSFIQIVIGLLTYLFYKNKPLLKQRLYIVLFATIILLGSFIYSIYNIYFH